MDVVRGRARDDGVKVEAKAPKQTGASSSAGHQGSRTPRGAVKVSLGLRAERITCMETS